MSIASDNNRGDTHKTAPGTLPPEALKRHKLTGGSVQGDGVVELKALNSWAHRGKLKNMIEMYSLYRLTSHNVIEKKLAKPLVLACGYWLNSVSAGSYKNRDQSKAAPIADASVGEDSGTAGVSTTY